MLILSRKVRQQILINGTIKVTILSVKGGRVQLGVDAPSSVGIRRVELPPHNNPEQCTNAELVSCKIGSRSTGDNVRQS